MVDMRALRFAAEFSGRRLSSCSFVVFVVFVVARRPVRRSASYRRVVVWCRRKRLCAEGAVTGRRRSTPALRKGADRLMWHSHMNDGHTPVRLTQERRWAVRNSSC